MHQVKVRIDGTSPLLMHAFPMVHREGIDKLPPEEQAEYHTYRCPETRRLYVLGVSIQRGLISAAGFSKGKGRTTLSKVAAAAMFVAESYCFIEPQTYVIDSRPVVIRATGGRVVRYRARFDSWRTSFTLEYDDTLLSATSVRKIVDDLGQRVGVLDFRPEHRGPFGRFQVTEWSG
jgi:hypothetical protein